MDQANILIIGGGVVGCAIASEVAAGWPDVFLLEQRPRLGMATSSRNSGVIHSGIYYPHNSLKARHCLEGNRLTFDFCEKNGVPHRRTGKLVVATDEHETIELEALKKRGETNGVEGLRMIGAAEIRAREPHVTGVAALDVPSTGIVSSEELVRAYGRLAANRGANIVTHARVVSLRSEGKSIRAGVRIGDQSDMGSKRAELKSRAQQSVGKSDGRADTAGELSRDEMAVNEDIEARCVINAAGLYADDVAAMLGNRSWKIYPVRGEYCEMRGARSSLINGLVYPLPHADGLSLGVHFTKTLWGTVLIGPTARYVDGKENYERDRIPIRDFAHGAQRLLPEISEGDLQLGYSGLRPKLVPPDEHGPADFVITRDAKTPSAIHLVGIESPGLTAALSIARQVCEMAAEILG
ncbi:MAG: NAD(P)/FAD-dependent oxidoreductase [Acidobacteriota bacterium]|nr:NAD(P)/FAD-dependent oxidoreductase [Acidobacteriota bacterium]